MTDRELLELAAKAAGYVVSTHSQKDGAFTLGGKEWNPLTDDGDALRLAVKLDFMFNNLFHNAYSKLYSEGQLPNDPYAATRRAIVRAAAEIGKGME